MRSRRKVFEVVLPRREQPLSGELVSSHLQALCMGVESSGARGGVSEMAFRSDWESSGRMESGGRGTGEEQKRSHL